MTSVELHRELLVDDSGLPRFRRTLQEGKLILPQGGGAFDIRHVGENVVVTGYERTTTLREGDNHVIAKDRDSRWRVVHTSRLPR